MAAKPEDIEDFNTAFSWLKDQEHAVQHALALRCALRVLPIALSHSPNEDVSDIKRDLTLQTFRATLTSSVASKIPTDEIMKAARSAAYAADAAALSTALSAADSADSADAAARAAAFAAAHAADSADFAESTDSADAALSAARSSAYAADATDAAFAASWSEFTADAVFTGSHGADALLRQPLFLAREQESEAFDLQAFVLKFLTNFEGSDEFKLDRWGVWTAWYRNLLKDTSRSLFTPEQEKQIALPDHDLWQDKLNTRNVVEVNAEIERIVGWPWDGPDDETLPQQDESAPSLPADVGPSPRFVAKAGKLDAELNLPTKEDLDDPHQARLLDRIKKRLGTLLSAEGNWLAQYPELDRVLTEYNDLLCSSELETLDVYEVWESGTALIAMARQFAALDPNQQTTLPLEPEQAAILGEVARLHGAFVMGFSAGRYWAERSGFPLLSPEEFRKLLDDERTIIRWLLENDQFAMTDRARDAFEQLDQNLALAGVNAEQLAVLGYPLVRSIIMFGARSLGAAKSVAEDVGLIGVPSQLAVIGILSLMRETAGPIFGIAASQDELRLYLEYHYRRLGIDFTERSSISDATKDSNDG